MTDLEKTGNFLKVGENEYPIETLTEKAKYLASQIQHLQDQATKTGAEIDRIKVANKGFTEMLNEELSNPEEV